MNDISEVLKGWLSPAGALLLLGGIVWGVQLNVATMNLSSQMSELNAKQGNISDRLLEVSDNSLRTTLLMKQLTERMAEMDADVDVHFDEAEDWKLKIIAIEERMRALEAR